MTITTVEEAVYDLRQIKKGLGVTNAISVPLLLILHGGLIEYLLIGERLDAGLANVREPRILHLESFPRLEFDGATL